MSSYVRNVSVEIGRIKELVRDIEVIVTVRIMHNGSPYEYFVCQLEFPHPRKQKTIKVARIDQSHGFLHLDKLWKKNNEKKKIHRDMNAWDAAEHLKRRWKKYCQKWANREDTEIDELIKFENL